MIHAVIRMIVFAWIMLGLSFPAAAQTLPGFGGGSSEETAGETDLDSAIRQAAESGVSLVVIDSNGRLITPEPQTEQGDSALASDGMSALMKTQSEFRSFRETLSGRLEALPSSLTEVAYILRATSPDGRIMTYVEVLFWSIVLFFFARIATTEIYGKRFARRFVVSRIQDNPQGYSEKMPFLVFRFVMGIGGTLFAMAFAYSVGILIWGRAQDISIEFTITAIFVTYFLSRTISDMWRMILSPFLPQYRIPFFSDRDAKRLYRWAAALATFDIFTVMFSTWIHDFGLNYNVHAILYGLLALVGALGNTAMVLFNRRAITGAICNGRELDELSWFMRFLSYAWAPLLIGYFVFGWLKLAFDLVLEREDSIPMIAGAYLIFMSMIVVYGVFNLVIERYFDRERQVNRINEELTAADQLEDAEDTADAAPDMARRPSISTYEELARRVAGILAFVAGSYAVLSIWDPNDTVLSESVVGRMLDVIFVLFVGYILYHFFRIWIDSKIDEESGGGAEVELGDEGGAAGVSRLATLLPLFRGAILAVVIVSIALIALMELGINVSPLFAGAGVVGLAVGFGAQTLVRDIFSGAFFLLDDAFRKGEYIDIGDVKGTVEKISVRSFQLRHHLGALHTIPFGEIRVLTNYSRDWVMMKLPLRVTYDTDVEKVRKLIKKLGQELLSDPVIGENFVQPLKSQGVIEMQDSAMIIRVKFMTKPGDQWLIRKKVYEEIRALFAREGIKFAHREVTVRLADADPKELTPEQRDALSGAVQTAIDEDLMDENPGGGGDDR